MTDGNENGSVTTEREKDYQAFLLGALSSMIRSLGMEIWQMNFEEGEDAYVFGELDGGQRFSLNVGFHKVFVKGEEE